MPPTPEPAVPERGREASAIDGDETVRLALRAVGFAGPASLGSDLSHIVTIRDALADLEVDKREDATGPVYAGSKVTYTIRVTNNGPTDAANISVYDVLWPPNHNLVNVSVTATASDDSGIDPIVSLLSVTSNEPDNGLGYGDTANDTTLGLPAERSGLGTGRVYTVTYQAVDACGNSTQASAVVTVPKSQAGS